MTHRDVPWFGPALLVVGVSVLAVSTDFVGAHVGTGIRLFAGVVALAALLWGAGHHGAGARGAWLLLALGIGAWVVLDAVWDTLDATALPDSSGWFDALNIAYLSLYPVVFLALIRLVHARGAGRSVDNVVDSAIMFLTAMLLMQILVINPLNGAGLDWSGALYPYSDALLLAAISWFAFNQARRNPSAWLLVAGIVLLSGVDAAWETSAQPLFGTLDQWLNPLYPIAYALIAASVLHPSVAHLCDLGEPRASEMHPVRMVFLCAALAMIPVAAFLGSANDVLVEVGVTALVAAVGIRFATLVRSIQRAHEQAEASATRFAALTAAVPVAILESDADLTISFANGEADRFLGASIVGRSAQDLTADIVDDRDQATLEAAVVSVFHGESASAQIRIRGMAGNQRWVAFSAVPVRKEPGPFEGAFVSLTDITPIKDAEEMLTLQVTHDPLTGLPNRRMLLDRLTGAITRLNRLPGSLAVLFLDLDGFKPVNDRFGHAAGDEVLGLVANRILHTVRAEDTVARLGGDEFVVLLERVTDVTDACSVAEKIIHAIEAPIALARDDVRVSASVGIAMTCDPHVLPDTLLRSADREMYEAKRSGHGLVRVAEDPSRRRSSPGPAVAR